MLLAACIGSGEPPHSTFFRGAGGVQTNPGKGLASRRWEQAGACGSPFNIGYEQSAWCGAALESRGDGGWHEVPGSDTFAAASEASSSRSERERELES